MATKSQLKKIHKSWHREQFKISDKLNKEEELTKKRNQHLENAEKINIEEDTSLPRASCIKIMHCKLYENSRVKIYGWVHRLRKQSKIFLVHLF